MVWTLKEVSGDVLAFPAILSLCRRLRATRVSLKPPELGDLGASMVWTWVCRKKSGGTHNTLNSNQSVCNALKSLMKYGQFVTFLKTATNCENFKGHLLSQSLERHSLVAVSHLTQRIKSPKSLR